MVIIIIIAATTITITGILPEFQCHVTDADLKTTYITEM
jgi:hypothetical protein